MSTFDALESSVESSRPIELYEFVLGSETFRYTSAEDTITFNTNDFAPEAIARNQVLQGSDSDTRTLSIVVPSNNAFASRFIDIVPGVRGQVSVFRFQRNEVPPFNTTVLLFKGTVQSVRFPNDGHSAEIEIRSIESALNRNVPRFTYMAMCNHFLYDSRCGADPSLFNHIGTVTAVSGNDITVSGALASGLDFVGGYCTPVSSVDFRMVIAQTGDVLTLLLPFSMDVLNQNLQVFAGCDHLIDGDCALVFDRVADFGGYAFVPNRNVFERGIKV